MDARDPWLKFFTSDHRADPGLRMCSFAARGLWIDMLCVMHEARPYGHLLVGGTAPTPANLANLFGGSSSQVRKLMDELEWNGVFSRTANGVIYSRRMLRDARRRETNRSNGGKGGNPRLLDNRNAAPLDNPPDIPGREGSDNPSVSPEARGQKPEAIFQNPKSSTAQQHAAAVPPSAAVDHRFEEVKAECKRHLGDRSVKDWQRVRVWLAHGADPVLDIYPTLERKAGRASGQGQPAG